MVTAGSKTSGDLPNFAETSQFQEFQNESDDDLEIQQAMDESQSELESQILAERAQLELETEEFNLQSGLLATISEYMEAGTPLPSTMLLPAGPSPPTGPCRPFCKPGCSHVLLCTRARNSQDKARDGHPITHKGFGGHSSER